MPERLGIVCPELSKLLKNQWPALRVFGTLPSKLLHNVNTGMHVLD